MELDKEEIIIMQALASQAKKVDELTKELKFDISTLNARLSLMEIKGLIGLSGGGFIALKRLKGK
jgi:predicted transcriptional regulator